MPSPVIGRQPPRHDRNLCKTSPCDQQQLTTRRHFSHTGFRASRRGSHILLRPPFIYPKHRSLTLPAASEEGSSLLLDLSMMLLPSLPVLSVMVLPRYVLTFSSSSFFVSPLAHVATAVTSRGRPLLLSVLILGLLFLIFLGLACRPRFANQGSFNTIPFGALKHPPALPWANHIRFPRCKSLLSRGHAPALASFLLAVVKSLYLIL